MARPTLTLADLEQIREKLGGSRASASHVEEHVLLAKIEKIIERIAEHDLLLEQPFYLIAVSPDEDDA